jgi:cytosine/adenosine deaminase-related metal-dependent hydrolase
VHATHLVPAEIDALAASGATVGLCPITEANLGDGLFPFDAFQRAGGVFGIGTDSNILISLTEELRLLEYGQRLKFAARNIAAALAGAATGRTLFDAALVGGGRAQGAAAGLAVGCAADVVCPDADHPSLLSRARDSLLDSLIFAGGAGVISAVWRAGCQVVRDGRHVERPAIIAAYRASLARLLA